MLLCNITLFLCIFANIIVIVQHNPNMQVIKQDILHTNETKYK